ncbi:MAG: Uma2 family endonuclease [Cytophagales bacterium]|nr:MAG: Uma2 family endonuclease [Cytophagales bacterium]
METMVLSSRQVVTDEEFFYFCQENPDHTFEREPNGRITVMPNTGGKTGRLNFKIGGHFFNWNETAQLGEAFDSSTAFRLPDGSTRSPDVAWICHDRWYSLTEREQEQFPPLCPDFVIVLRSATDSNTLSKKKMTDVWIANGCRLAWLIDPSEQLTHVFRANGEIQIIPFSKPLLGEDVLPGFELRMG